MFTVPIDDDAHQSIYMSGTFSGLGSVMKFYKKNAALRWHAQLNTMTQVNAIALHPTRRKGHFFGCGANRPADRGQDVNQRSSESEAWFFSMDSDGEISWQISLSGSALGSNLNSDSCEGITFDTRVESLVTVIETTSPQFRVKRSGKQKDTMLLEIATSGALEKVISFTLGSNMYDMLSFQ